MECIVCGTSFCVRDCTSNAVSYGDDLAYSSFAYRRDSHFNEVHQHYYSYYANTNAD